MYIRTQDGSGLREGVEAPRQVRIAKGDRQVMKGREGGVRCDRPIEAAAQPRGKFRNWRIGDPKPHPLERGPGRGESLQSPTGAREVRERIGEERPRDEDLELPGLERRAELGWPVSRKPAGERG